MVNPLSVRIGEQNAGRAGRVEPHRLAVVTAGDDAGAVRRRLENDALMERDAL